MSSYLSKWMYWTHGSASQFRCARGLMGKLGTPSVAFGIDVQPASDLTYVFDSTFRRGLYNKYLNLDARAREERELLLQEVDKATFQGPEDYDHFVDHVYGKPDWEHTYLLPTQSAYYQRSGAGVCRYYLKDSVTPLTLVNRERRVLDAGKRDYLDGNIIRPLLDFLGGNRGLLFVVSQLVNQGGLSWALKACFEKADIGWSFDDSPMGLLTRNGQRYIPNISTHGGDYELHTDTRRPHQAHSAFTLRFTQQLDGTALCFPDDDMPGPLVDRLGITRLVATLTVLLYTIDVYVYMDIDRLECQIITQ